MEGILRIKDRNQLVPPKICVGAEWVYGLPLGLNRNCFITGVLDLVYSHGLITGQMDMLCGDWHQQSCG